VKRIALAFLVIFGLAAFGASAQTAPNTLARVKADREHVTTTAIELLR
jgi:hypothetical protein